MAVTSRITVSEKSTRLTRLSHRPGMFRRSKVAQRANPLAAAQRYALVPSEWGVCGVQWQLHACSWPGRAAPAAAAGAGGGDRGARTGGIRALFLPKTARQVPR
ncbi:MAG: hypothetical protein WCI73_20325, partial [Phycisphaerae bacterium]